MTNTRIYRPSDRLPAFIITHSVATSREGRILYAVQRQTRKHFRASNSIGQADLHNRLDLLAQSCQDADWDGYDAVPVDPRSVHFAHELIDALPQDPTRSLFSMGAEPDGHITFEWHRSPSWTLSVSISPFAEAHYSALLGPDRRYGTESLGAPVRLPSSLRELIQRIEVAGAKSR